jgi:hypothetical protein
MCVHASLPTTITCQHEIGLAVTAQNIIKVLIGHILHTFLLLTLFSINMFCWLFYFAEHLVSNFFNRARSELVYP